MGYQCKTDCQIEVSPGVFKFIQKGQTHFDMEKKRPITYVKPISRKYFRLTGEDIKKDIQDKGRIIEALQKRNVKIPKNPRTADVAKLLAIDNRSRGIMNLESLNIASAPNHIADKKVIDAKARVDELFELSSEDDYPYDDETTLDDLNKLIADKEAEIASGNDGNPELSKEELRAQITELNGTFAVNDNKAKLKEILAGLKASG